MKKATGLCPDTLNLSVGREIAAALDESTAFTRLGRLPIVFELGRVQDVKLILTFKKAS